MAERQTVLCEVVAVPMADGTALAADVFRPANGRPRPVLLVRTPYARTHARRETDPVRLVRGGWAVVLQDVRGRHDSGGRFTPFEQELADGRDSILWCRRQPWATIDVAMSGVSYEAMCAWLAALEGEAPPSALATMLTGSGACEGWTYEGGTLRHAFVQSWGLSFAYTDRTLPVAARRTARRLARRLEDVYAHVPARSPIGDVFGPYAEWLRVDSELWARVDLERSYHKLDVPAYHVSGWYDIFCEGTMRNFTGMRAHARSERARSAQRLVVGPWSHDRLFEQVIGDVDFGLHASQSGVPEEAERWLARAVRGRKVIGGARIFVMGDQRWVELPGWPPPHVRCRLYLIPRLAAGGTLDAETSERTLRCTLRYDPTDPVPTTGGRTLDPTLGGRAGPVDQAPIEGRDDVLSFTTPVLRRTVTLGGMVTASIELSSSAPSADLAVKLCDVEPDGRSLNVVDAIQRSWGPPGRCRTVRIVVGSTAYAFRRGHRLRVLIAASNFPHADLNPSTDEPSMSAVCHLPAEHTILSGGGPSSYVELPVWRGRPEDLAR